MTDTSHPDDARLIAYLDGDLSGAERDALKSRLSSDETLRARLDRIERGGRLVAPALEVLRGEAPRARLEARLAAAIASDETRLVLERPRARGWGLPIWQPRLVAAALALFLLGGLAGVWVDGRMQRDTGVTEAMAESWHQAVAEYWSLTTPDTLALAPTPERAAAELQAASAKLGVDLSAVPDAFPGLSFRGAQLFEYRGRPLVQIAYLDPQHGPIAYCVIADPDHKERAPTTEELDGFTVVHWASGGQARLLIGRAPAERLQALAQKVT